LGNVRELTDSTGTIQAQYDYDPYGNTSLIQGTNMADFQYAGMYEHQTSGLNLTLYRCYNPNTGRWLSRDPLGEGADSTLYSYVLNVPVLGIDPLGLVAIFTYTNGTQTTASTTTQFENAANSPAAQNGGIQSIVVDGHGSEESQSLTDNTNGPEITTDGNGNVILTNNNSTLNAQGVSAGDVSGTSLSSILQGKLASNATISLNGCNTGNPVGSAATNIAQQVANATGVPTIGSIGQSTYYYPLDNLSSLFDDLGSYLDEVPTHISSTPIIYFPQ
jgi:RHS repeat-associated protein